MRMLPIFFLLLSLIGKTQKNHLIVLENYMQAQEKVNEFSGAVLVAKQGKILYKKAFGLANRELNVPNTIQTKFRIGSLTKQFTAAAILQLQEAGKLKIEDKLSKFFPDFPKGDSVTIHMLLNHTSGIKSYTSISKFPTVSVLPYEKDSVVAFFKNEPYEFSPGTNWNYNNSGYFLLGYIIEKVSGQTYSNYVLENLVKKAGLENTAVDRLDSILKNRAVGYSRTQAGWRNAQHISMEFPYSAGAMISTVEDLYKWNKALFSGNIISTEMVRKMTTPYLKKYGYGLIIDSMYHQKRIAHSGGIPGFMSYDLVYLPEDIHIIVLSNNSSGSPAIANTLGAILFDKEVVLPYKHQEIKTASKDIEKFVGKYQSPDNVFEIFIKDGKLFGRVGTSNDIGLKAESSNKFFYADGSDKQLNFILNNDKRIDKVQLIRSGVVEELKRMN